MDIDVQQSLSQFKKDHLLLKTVCAKQENLPKVKELIAAGASVDAMNYDNNKKVLMYAAEKGYINIAKFLLENNAHVNYVTLWDENALMLAFLGDSPIEMFQLLLEKGADFNQGDHIGRTTFDMAKEYYNKNPEYVHCILSTMTYSEVESFSTESLENSKIVSDFLIYNRKKLFSIISLNHLESKLIPELTHHILNVVASNSGQHISKWYVASPYFKKDIDFFITYLRQKAQQTVFPSIPLTESVPLDHIPPSLQDAQDSDAILSEETFDLTPQMPTVIFSEEPKEKSCSDMMIEGFIAAKEGVFNLFSKKRKRDDDTDVNEKNQDSFENPTKKAKLN